MFEKEVLLTSKSLLKHFQGRLNLTMSSTQSDSARYSSGSSSSKVVMVLVAIIVTTVVQHHGDGY